MRVLVPVALTSRPIGTKFLSRDVYHAVELAATGWPSAEMYRVLKRTSRLLDLHSSDRVSHNLQPIVPSAS